MLLYVLRYYPTLTETFVYREIAAVQQHVPVAIAALGEREDGRHADELPDAEVWRLPRGLAGLSLLRHPAASKRQARLSWLAERARSRGVTRIHAHFAGEAAEWARDLAARLQVPFSVTVHAVDLFVPRPQLTQTLAAADDVITVCAHHREVLADMGISARVVRCGVDPSRYAQARPDAGRQVLCVARDVPKKGLDQLVSATRSAGLPLRLISDSKRFPEVCDGPLPPSAVPGALADAHLFALACRIADNADRDGIPLVLLEAMAAGLPVVTTAVAGIPELVDDAVGWLVPPDAPHAFEAALIEARDNPALRARKGRAARQRILERDLTVQAQARGLLRDVADV